ncbi:hypothetical protein Agabi119p4_9867 [Agaricus bisporus var. burnettii]|uniref:Uncharacterized protein n=1 Tax=Agaricus bisporus var. burnettii TaxID=192524 RepID=A0A8H7EXQ8_AGABI|nr:hypothetical protein Agabi119p4_9867 [Agaricus bisporus var. burnettii]
MTHGSKVASATVLSTPQFLSNFLQLDQRSFYKAMHGLHSIMKISKPKDAALPRLQFHHSSFHDFLLNSNRYGRFTISERGEIMDIVRSGIYWYEADAIHFHSHDGWAFDWDHKHDDLPGLLWVSDNRRFLSASIARFLEYGLFSGDFYIQWDTLDEHFLVLLSDLNFRSWYAWDVFLLARFCRLDPLTSTVGTAPLRDRLPDGQWILECFFIGHAVKSVIICRTKSPNLSHEFVYSLRCDQKPLEAQISQYEKCLLDIKWDEEEAKLKMK